MKKILVTILKGITAYLALAGFFFGLILACWSLEVLVPSAERQAVQDGILVVDQAAKQRRGSAGAISTWYVRGRLAADSVAYYRIYLNEKSVRALGLADRASLIGTRLPFTYSPHGKASAGDGLRRGGDFLVSNWPFFLLAGAFFGLLNRLLAAGDPDKPPLRRQLQGWLRLMAFGASLFLLLYGGSYLLLTARNQRQLPVAHQERFQVTAVAPKRVGRVRVTGHLSRSATDTIHLLLTSNHLEDLTAGHVIVEEQPAPGDRFPVWADRSAGSVSYRLLSQPPPATRLPDAWPRYRLALRMMLTGLALLLTVVLLPRWTSSARLD